MPRLFDGEHYFRLVEDGGGTRLVHRETLKGILLWGVDVTPFELDFERMNIALKTRVETSE